jgi:hypothetical protein
MKYFQFALSAVDGSNSKATLKWMDERISTKVTIEDIAYFDCDIVALSIKGAICSERDLISNGGHYDLDNAVSITREGANVSEISSTTTIPWRTMSTVPAPDAVSHSNSGVPGTDHTTWIVDSVRFEWNRSWHDDFWLVNYGYDGKLRRTRFNFRDHEGNNHHYYVIPWAAPL